MSAIKSLSTRKIGPVNVSAIGYGAMSLGNKSYGYGGTDEDRFKILDRLFELGCRTWDTADIYGDSEELIGKWFARTGKRDQIFLSTKFGIDRSDPKNPGVRGDPEYARQTFAKSLRLLQTDYVDLLYQHRSDPKTPIEITFRTMKEFVEEGKVRYLGISEATPSGIRRAHKIHPISAVQVEYSPWELSEEKPGGIIETARELGITIVAYSPTGRGIGTGRWRSFDELPEGDFRRTVPKYAAKNWPKINKLIDAFLEIGKKYNATPAQVNVAWLLKQGDDVIPIPGSKQVKYVEENLATLDVDLSAEDVAEIRRLAEAVNQDIGGDARYGANDMSAIQTETPPLQE